MKKVLIALSVSTEKKDLVCKNFANVSLMDIEILFPSIRGINFSNANLCNPKTIATKIKKGYKTVSGALCTSR